MKSTDNPLLGNYPAEFGIPPFHKIDHSNFRPAIDFAIKEALEEITSITDNPSNPDFANTILPLEESSRKLGQVAAILFNLNSAETNPCIQAATAEISPLLTRFSNDITLNRRLFERVRSVWQSNESESLSVEEKRLLADRYRSFRIGGAELSGKERDRFRAVSEELSSLTVKFEENLLAETNNFELHLTKESELEGLPESVCQAAQLEAEARGKKGWVFTLHSPSYIPFMQNSRHRHLREKMFMAYSSRCFRGNEYDNQEIVLRIVNLRLELATLLGYGCYADMVLEERMAGSAVAVNDFLSELFRSSRPAAVRDFTWIEEFARSKGHGDRLMRWDWPYYSEWLKREEYDIDDEILRPYFELAKTQHAVFALASRLYGITFSEVKGVPAYHEEVTTWDVRDKDGSHLAILMTDFHPRSSKSGGAWMTSYREQYIENGEDTRPVISIVMNFTRPSGGRPALLTHNELTTLLHEFGHALHGILSKCRFESQSGTNVRRDFVELPSQIMENWAFEKDWLESWAVHYQTGEKIPARLIDKIKAAHTYNEGYACNRQLGFGLLDMAWHTTREPYSGAVDEFENLAVKETDLFPVIRGINQSCGFGHLFSGGYAAGYYGYKWAEVLDADAFSLFRENGIFDTKTASRFRSNILEKGGSDDPASLYRNFRGKEPAIEALLERSGFTTGINPES